MRYPIYFFLLLSGFFYLTGKPNADKPMQTANLDGQITGSGATTLPYARKIAKQSEAGDDNTKMAKVVSESVKTVRNKPANTWTLPTAKTDLTKASKPASKADMMKNSVRQASLDTRNNVTATEWKTTVKLSKKETALGTAIGTHLANRESFDSQPRKYFRSAKRKKLDWTVFGNGRKTVSTAALPKRVRSRDELDAEGLSSDNIISDRRRVTKRRAASRVSRKAQRRAKRNANKRRVAYKAKKRYSAKKRRARRYARLHRKNRNIRRIAKRRSAKKPRRRRYASHRRHRKRFGFGTIDGVTSLFGGN